MKKQFFKNKRVELEKTFTSNPTLYKHTLKNFLHRDTFIEVTMAKL